MANDEVMNTTNGAMDTIPLFGRRTIYTGLETLDGLSDEEIVNELNTALVYHNQNLLEEDYLYWYRRGLQPILYRTKERNGFINNKVQENHADEIVSFKDGFLLQRPISYISRSDDSEVTRQVALLNEYLYRAGKAQADNEIVDWFHTVGKGVLFVRPNEDIDVPFSTFALDPRSAFVVYSMRPGNEPVYAVNAVVVGNKIFFDLITPRMIYKLSGGITAQTLTKASYSIGTAIQVDARMPNPLGLINLVEYQYNSVGMAAFEIVIPLLNSLNLILSNRLDGIEQFIQSLVVLYNAKLPDGEDANSLRKKGLLLLQSLGEARSDIKILSEQLNQAQTQVLVDYLYQQVLTIVGMPSTTKGNGSTSDTGSATFLRDGWANADTFARNTEDLFKKSNRYFDRIMLKILRTKLGIDLKISDFDINFVRDEVLNVQAKAQACNTMLASGFAPVLAFAKSGISSDPVQDVAISEEWLKLRWGKDADTEDVVKDVSVSDGIGA